MNIEQLRESLKLQWVKYYCKNRPWLTKMRIWGTYNGQRRPSSDFILATLSVLEPQLDEVLPFLLELNRNPDRIVAALNLNFNPEEHLHLIKENNADEHQDADDSAVMSILREKYNHRNLGDRKLYPLPSLTAIAKADNNKPAPLLTLISRNESHAEAVSSMVLASYFEESNCIPLPSVVAANEVESEFESLPAIIANEVESKDKLVKMPLKEFQDHVNSFSIKKLFNFTAWIDDFCQGVGWDKEEAIFIPF
ncbi:DUF5331 domain-containing protein [Chlorogloeopsis fritschii PCC 9212]|uniref:DUF5331 domain-containing protein n=1 Tax=Chlorogloeopsis fritschii PCC 6912 TaxID=211165 RepID=A0A3S1FAL0_CHLFR|nr:DUF5331 domain-containing protein [Chlorogloeopsis fritschii]RUR74185.1 hypothetical protein PCC6912_52860 [Chlorogloeopsis fritschii PCC 6912]